MIQIDIDSGKFSGKGKLGDLLKTFDSKISKGIAQFKGSYTVEYDNEFYIVGEEGREYNYELSKNTFHNKLIIYTMICILLEDKNDEIINLTVGTPTQLFFNKEDKDAYANNLKNNGETVRIKLDGEEKRFKINNVVVAPETIGSQILDKDSKNKVKGVIDLGGLNLNGAIYLHGKPQRDRIITKNMGTHILVSNIQQELIKNVNEVYEDYLIHDFILHGNGRVEIRKVIDEYCYDFMESIIKEMQKYKWNYEDIEMEFTGGGSILLKKYIEETFGDVVIIEDVYYTVKGFSEFGGVKHGKANN